MGQSSVTSTHDETLDHGNIYIHTQPSKLSDGSVKLFKDDQELQEYEDSKISDVATAAGRRQLEMKLARLNSLKRPSDTFKIQLDSEKNSEVFQQSHYQRSRRSPDNDENKSCDSSPESGESCESHEYWSKANCKCKKKNRRKNNNNYKIPKTATTTTANTTTTINTTTTTTTTTTTPLLSLDYF